jgi:hypothetical protein
VSLFGSGGLTHQDRCHRGTYLYPVAAVAPHKKQKRGEAFVFGESKGGPARRKPRKKPTSKREPCAPSATQRRSAHQCLSVVPGNFTFMLTGFPNCVEC